MATFLMFGKYTSGTEKISADRTKQAQQLFKKLGGEIKDMYALLGEHDLVMIAELPGIREATKASIALGRMTGISFSTAAAISVSEFDALISEL